MFLYFCIDLQILHFLRLITFTIKETSVRVTANTKFPQLLVFQNFIRRISLVRRQRHCSVPYSYLDSRLLSRSFSISITNKQLTHQARSNCLISTTSYKMAGQQPFQRIRSMILKCIYSYNQSHSFSPTMETLFFKNTGNISGAYREPVVDYP